MAILCNILRCQYHGIHLKIVYYMLMSFLLFIQTGSRNCVLTQQEARYVNELARNVTDARRPPRTPIKPNTEQTKARKRQRNRKQTPLYVEESDSIRVSD